MPLHNFSMLGQSMQFTLKLRGYVDDGDEMRVKDYILDALEGLSPVQIEAHPAKDVIDEAIGFLESRGWSRQTHKNVLYLVHWPWDDDPIYFSNRKKGGS